MTARKRKINFRPKFPDSPEKLNQADPRTPENSRYNGAFWAYVNDETVVSASFLTSFSEAMPAPPKIAAKARLDLKHYKSKEICSPKKYAGVARIFSEISEVFRNRRMEIYDKKVT